MIEFFRMYLPLPAIGIAFITLLGTSLHYFWYVFEKGKELAGTIRPYDSVLLNEKKRMLKWAYGTLAATVCTLETGLLLYGTGGPASPLLEVHWVFVGGFILATTFTLHFNGLRSKRLHWRFAYSTFAAFLLVLVTGALLGYEALV